MDTQPQQEEVPERAEQVMDELAAMIVLGWVLGKTREAQNGGVTKLEGGSEMVAAFRRLATVLGDRAALDAQDVAEMEAGEYEDVARTLPCAYCAESLKVPAGADASAVARAHVATCPAHPLRATEAERDRLAQRVEVLEAALRRIVNVLHEGDHGADEDPDSLRAFASGERAECEPCYAALIASGALAEGSGSGEREPSDAEVMAWALTLGRWGVFKRRVRAEVSQRMPEGWEWHRVDGLGEKIPGAIVFAGPWGALPPIPGLVREEYTAAHATPEATHAL